MDATASATDDGYGYGGYKAEKEAFVSGTAGSSIAHVTLVSLVALAAVALHAALSTRISAFSSLSRSRRIPGDHKYSRSRSPSPSPALSPSPSPFTSPISSTTSPSSSQHRKRQPRTHAPGPGLLVSYLTLVFPLLLSMTLFASPGSSLFSYLSFFTSSSREHSHTRTNAGGGSTGSVHNDADWALWPPFLLCALLAIPTAVILLVKERVDVRMRGALPVRSPVRPGASRASSFLSSSSNNERGIDATMKTNTVKTVKTVKMKPLPALTTYRAHMMLMTVLAILAVDFRVFPRALAKCESWGVGLMDLGVGSFVFSQGIVSARSLLLEPLSLSFPASSSPSSPLTPSSPLSPLTTFLHATSRSLRKSLPLLILGIARLVLVKASDYPEHVAEYGVHWNFFLTLAAVAVGQVVVVRGVRVVFGALSGVLGGRRAGGSPGPMVMGGSPGPMVMGVNVAIFQYLLLHPHFVALQTYVHSDTPRTTALLSASLRQIIDSNREGLVSLPGYLAIHLLGMAAGAVVLPPTPGVYRKGVKVVRAVGDAWVAAAVRRIGNGGHATNDRQIEEAEEKANKAMEEYKRALAAPKELDKTATELGGQAILWWALLGVVKMVGVDPEGVSRRLVNLSYILWVAAFNTSFLLGYIVVLDLGIYASGSASGYDNPYIERTPAAVKKHRAPLSPGLNPSGEQRDGGLFSANRDTDEDRREGEREAESVNPPRLLAAINHHGLSVFLVANVLTGLINLSIHSTRVGDAPAMAVLTLYSFVLCAIAWVIY